MRWRNKLVALAWTIFVIWSATWLIPRWYVDTPLQNDSALLPFARTAFIPESREDTPGIPSFRQVYHFLYSPDHVEELEQAPGVERVVLTELEPVPLPATQMVDHIVVDGIVITYTEDEDPIKGPILARVLNDAAEIEWRMLWKRALIGTAIWITALIAMLGLTHKMKQQAAQPCRTAEQG